MPQTGANSTSTGGTVSKLTGGYALYPMAEVLGVFDAATKSVDGQLTLAANTVPWAANDPVEEPHYYQQHVAADSTFVGQTTPRPTISQTAGVQYEAERWARADGWTMQTPCRRRTILGNGGTHTVPGAAYVAQGIWQRTMDDAGGRTERVFGSLQLAWLRKWNSGYDLFELDSNASVDTVVVSAETSTLQMSMRGTAYQFSPQAFTAGTINAGTVNATT